MQTRQDNQVYEVQFPGLPLAVYREIAAHLRQVEGVEVGFTPQLSQQFDYDQSQLGGLWIQYVERPGSGTGERIAQILAYYQNRYPQK